MITGFNTDIEFEGKIFHVQTEDRGLDHPVIESLVYVGGEILSSRKTPYDDLIESGSFEESVLQQRLKTQHLTVIREIQTGSMFEGEQIPFGWNVVSNLSFDQVVLRFLQEAIALESLSLDWLEPKTLRAGERPRIKVALTEQSSERPVVGGTVIVKLIGGKQSTELFAGTTDESGLLEVVCDIPAKPGASPTIVCEAEAAGKTAEVRHPVRRAARASIRRS
jgi:hypothetical protein